MSDGDNTSSGASQYEQIVCKQLNEIFSRNVGKFDDMMSLTIKRRLNDADVVKAIDDVVEDKLKTQITDALTRTMEGMESDGVYRNIMSEDIHKIFNEDIKKILLASISGASDDVRRQVCSDVADKISGKSNDNDVADSIIDVETTTESDDTDEAKQLEEEEAAVEKLEEEEAKEEEAKEEEAKEEEATEEEAKEEEAKEEEAAVEKLEEEEASTTEEEATADNLEEEEDKKVESEKKGGKCTSRKKRVSRSKKTGKSDKSKKRTSRRNKRKTKSTSK